MTNEEILAYAITTKKRQGTISHNEVARMCGTNIKRVQRIFKENNFQDKPAKASNPLNTGVA